MKVEFKRELQKEGNLLLYFSEEKWKGEKGSIKKKVGDDFSGKQGKISVVYDENGFSRVFLAGLG